MRELGLLLLDVVVAVALFVVGAVIHLALGWRSWFIPVSMLPFFMWLCWRRAVPYELIPRVLAGLAAFSLYFGIRDAFWPNPPDWYHWIDFVFALVLIWCTDRLIGWWTGLTRRCS
jgi:hypothetical protein